MNKLEVVLRALEVYKEFEYEFWMDRHNQVAYENIDQYVEDQDEFEPLSELVSGAIIFGNTDQGRAFWYEVIDSIDKIEVLKRNIRNER